MIALATTVAFGSMAAGSMGGMNGGNMSYDQNDGNYQKEAYSQHEMRQTGYSTEMKSDFYSLKLEDRQRLCSDESSWKDWAKYTGKEETKRDMYCADMYTKDEHASMDHEQQYGDKQDEQWSKDSSNDEQHGYVEVASSQKHDNRDWNKDQSYTKDEDKSYDDSKDQGWKNEDDWKDDSWKHEDKEYGYAESWKSDNHQDNDYRYAKASHNDSDDCKE
jgi:hypothetical protein